MDRLRRIAMGALAGALLTLAIHPVSRRFVLSAFTDVGPSVQLSRSVWLPRNLDVLPPPADILTASLWMQVGADLVVDRKPLKPDDLARLVEVAKAASKGDTDNAFWRQMEACFLWQQNKRGEALQAWIKGSKLGQWNDQQSRRLMLVRQELAAAAGGPMAWHSAAAYFQRSTSAAAMTESLARDLIERLELSPEKMLELRIATLRNGRLLRDQSRSVAVGNHGATVIDIACQPERQRGRSRPRQLVLSRFALIDELRNKGLSQDLAFADEAFRTNDAWGALAAPVRVQENAQSQASLSILLADGPGCLLLVCLLGFLLRGFVFALERLPRAQILLRPPFAPSMGVLVGFALYVQTGLVLAAIAVSLCFSFLAFEPERIRKKLPDRMGLAFRATVAMLALVFALLVVGFWIGIGTPAYEMVRHIGLPAEFFGGNTTFLSLAVLAVSLLFLAAPGWAIVERVPTPFATLITLRDFARRLAWGGLAACVIAVPAAVYLDSQARPNIDVLLTNEPIAYLLQ